MKNLFIVVDGMDGAGKTQLICSLQAKLYQQYKQLHVLTTREPTGGTFGLQIRELLKTQTDPSQNKERMIELFLADRKEHVDTLIQPLLEHEENRIILCDRYYHSTIAFQHVQGADKQQLIEQNASFPVPDLTLILDLEPKRALSRCSGRETKETFEQLEFMTSLRQAYLDLKTDLPDQRIEIVDATPSAETVAESCMARIQSLLRK